MKKLTAIIVMFIAVICLSLPLCGQMLTGYNNPYFFNQFKSGYPTDSVINAIKSLNLAILRFPGGTLSFLFDINRSGYGQPGSTAQNYAYAHARLATELGVKTSYVANLYPAIVDPAKESYTIENIVATVKVLNPEYIELSNELYLYEHITGVKTGDPRWWESKSRFTASVQAAAIRYTDLCKKVMEAIREAGFQPKFGAIMDNAAHTRGKVWNAAVRANLTYDYEVFHYYSTRRTADDIYKDLQRNFAGGTKPIAVTEYWWDFGYDGEKNTSDYGKDYVNNFEANMEAACRRDARVFMRCRHQLAGKNNYSAIKI